MMAIAAIGIVVLLIVIYLISTYNGFVRLRNKCEEAFSAMDVSLKKRYDLIPNLVETVKGYAKHESETLQAVIAARNKAAGASTAEARIEGDAALTGTLRHLFAVAESYPELKANENFTRLQDQLSRIEEEIAGSRRYYNGVVNKYNTKTEMFPSSLIAGMFGFARKPLYEVNSDAERENVTVSF
ncbi:MAG: LemA family protein [Blautia sp.]|nr:LemA family protein [Blautia sp.]